MGILKSECGPLDVPPSSIPPCPTSARMGELSQVSPLRMGRHPQPVARGKLQSYCNPHARTCWVGAWIGGRPTLIESAMKCILGLPVQDGGGHAPRSHTQPQSSHMYPSPHQRQKVVKRLDRVWGAENQGNEETRMI